MGREGERVQDQAHSQDFVVHFDHSIGSSNVMVIACVGHE